MAYLLNEKNKKFEIKEGTTTLGRGKFDIDSPKCSRNQAEIKIKNNKITITSIGKNPVVLKDGDDDDLIKTEPNKEYKLKDGSSFYLVPGECLFTLKVNEDSSLTEELTEEQKNKLTKNPSISENKKNKQKREDDSDEDSKSEDKKTNKRKREDDSDDDSKKKNKKHDSDEDSKKKNKKHDDSDDDSKAKNKKTNKRNKDDSDDDSKTKNKKTNKRKREDDSDEDEPPAKRAKVEKTENKGNLAVEGLEWRTAKNHQTLHILTSPALKSSTKIAAFDMDGTLIATKSGKKFPTSRTDWKWLFPSVKPALLELIQKGFKIVIFTNQGGAGKSAQKENELKGKMIDMIKDLGAPFEALMATKEDIMRKPGKALWEYFIANVNKNAEIDYENSFFVGDAAGREDNWKPKTKKDFSCSDRKFAANIGLKFYTPEEFFEKESPSPFEWGGKHPKDILLASKGKSPFPKGIDSVTSSTQELVLMVGMPASGKSYFSKKYLEAKGYVRVNRDTLKTQDKCEKAVNAAFEKGLSVVVDNTNPDVASRARFIKIAKQHSVPVRCFVMTTTKELATHLNHFREMLSKGETKRVPTIAYNTFKSKFKMPKKEEGIKEILEIDFVPELSKNEEKLFVLWT